MHDGVLGGRGAQDTHTHTHTRKEGRKEDDGRMRGRRPSPSPGQRPRAQPTLPTPRSQASGLRRAELVHFHCRSPQTGERGYGSVIGQQNRVSRSSLLAPAFALPASSSFFGLDLSGAARHLGIIKLKSSSMEKVHWQKKKKIAPIRSAHREDLLQSRARAT